MCVSVYKGDVLEGAMYGKAFFMQKFGMGEQLEGKYLVEVFQALFLR